MSDIPVHKLGEMFEGEMAALLYYADTEQMPRPLHAGYAHRDDYYIFFFLEEADCCLKMLIDFEEHEMRPGNVQYILPGQVHVPVGNVMGNGWALIVDGMLIKSEYKEVFEKAAFNRHNITPSPDEAADMRHCLTMLKRRMNRAEKDSIKRHVVHDLVSSYLGILADICRKRISGSASQRLLAITAQFRSLLSENCVTEKSPSRYAEMMHLSPVYLNEVIKKSTGLTVSETIRAEVVLQAKRLLYHTDMPVKEIALKLGYDDWAYFTRLFTKTAGITPTCFRGQHLK